MRNRLMMRKSFRWALLLTFGISVSAIAENEVTLEEYTPPVAAKPAATAQSSMPLDESTMSSDCFRKIPSGATIEQVTANLGPEFIIVTSGKVYLINNKFVETPEGKTSTSSLEGEQSDTLQGKFYYFKPKQENASDQVIDVHTDLDGKVIRFISGIPCH
jgi:hypothetical protein